MPYPPKYQMVSPLYDRPLHCSKTRIWTGHGNHKSHVQDILNRNLSILTISNFWVKISKSKVCLSLIKSDVLELMWQSQDTLSRNQSFLNKKKKKYVITELKKSSFSQKLFHVSIQKSIGFLVSYSSRITQILKEIRWGIANSQNLWFLKKN